MTQLFGVITSWICLRGGWWASEAAACDGLGDFRKGAQRRTKARETDASEEPPGKSWQELLLPRLGQGRASRQADAACGRNP